MITKKRIALISIEIFAVLFLLGVAGGVFAFGRLLSGPVSFDFAKPYILEALHDDESGLRVDMDEIVLSWPKLRGPLLLGLKGGRVYRDDGQVVLSIDEAALGLSKARLLIGQIAPTALILRQPSLKVIRHKDNSFDVGLERGIRSHSPVAQASDADPLKTLFDIIRQERGGADVPSFLTHLKSLEIEGAKVVVDDRVVNMSWTLPRADTLIERVPGGLSWTSTIVFDEQVAQPSTLKVKALFAHDTDQIKLDIMLEHFKPALLAERLPELAILENQKGRVNGHFQMHLKEAATLQESVQDAQITLLSEKGALDFADLSAKPLAFTDLGIVAAYDGAAKTLSLKRAQVTLNQTAHITVSAELALSENALKGPVKIAIGEIAHKDIAPLWPDVLKDEPAYEWVVEKLSQGTFSALDAEIDFDAHKGEDGWDVDADNITATFAFEDVDVNYRAPLKPIENASGTGTFDFKSETLRIDIDAAELGDMTITKAKVELINIIEAGKGVADIDITLQGPLKTVLLYVQDEPVDIHTGIDVPNVKGVADFQVHLSMPTRADLRVEDVKIGVQGTMSDVSLPKIVQDVTLTGGPFTLEVAGNDFRVKGAGLLEGKPARLEYHEFLNTKSTPYSSKLTASASVDKNVRDKFGMDLSVFMDGEALVKVDYTKYQDGRAQADVLADIGPARLFIEPFDYEKKPGAAGTVSLKAILKNDILTEIRDLTGSAPRLTLEPARLRFRQKKGETELASGKLSRFTLGETVATLDFNIAPSGAMKFILDGPFLDARPFLDNEEDKGKPYTAPPMEVSVSVDRMRTTDEETVQYAKIYANIDGKGRFEQLELDSIVGQGDVYLRFKPDESGKRVFRLEADDAGATLRAFGLYGNIIGGQMVIYGEPVGGVRDRNLRGVAELTNFKAVKAPSLARLLGALSLPGVLQLLDDDGLSFTKLESKFDWRFRPHGSLLVLKDGRSSGNSLGLTFDGTFDNAAGTLDVSGTIIPLSGINSIIGSIPLVGDILTGGTGALFAATYSMKGPAANPKTLVNPLAVLTPGILRRILFE